MPLQAKESTRVSAAGKAGKTEPFKGLGFGRGKEQSARMRDNWRQTFVFLGNWVELGIWIGIGIGMAQLAKAKPCLLLFTFFLPGERQSWWCLLKVDRTGSGQMLCWCAWGLREPKDPHHAWPDGGQPHHQMSLNKKLVAGEHFQTDWLQPCSPRPGDSTVSNHRQI